MSEFLYYSTMANIAHGVFQFLIIAWLVWTNVRLNRLEKIH